MNRQLEPDVLLARIRELVQQRDRHKRKEYAQRRRAEMWRARAMKK